MTREEILKKAGVKPDTFCPGCWHHVKKILRVFESDSVITADLEEHEVRAAAAGEVPQLHEFEIWSEGFQCTGDAAPAMKHGTAEAETFREACIDHFKNDQFFDGQDLTYWGCKLFDNEADARKSFG